MKLNNYNSKKKKGKYYQSKKAKKLDLKKITSLKKKRKNRKFRINGGMFSWLTDNTDKPEEIQGLIRTSSTGVHNQGKNPTCYSYAASSALKTILVKFDEMGHTSGLPASKIPSTEELRQKILEIGENAYSRADRRRELSFIETINPFVQLQIALSTNIKYIIEQVLKDYPIYNNLIERVYKSFDPDVVWNKINDMNNGKAIVGVYYSVGMPRFVWINWNTKDVITQEHCKDPDGEFSHSSSIPPIGHGMVVVGCNTRGEEKTLIIKNSHGERFGNNGFIEVAFSALNAPNVQSMYYIIE